MMRIVLLALVVLMASAAPAAAQGFAELTYSNVASTLARFNALNLANDAVVDDYAKLNDCDNYYKNFRDDFAMQAQREALRKRVKADASQYPDAYFFTSKMMLDRYDFKSRIFRLHEKSRLANINSFKLVEHSQKSVCVKGQKLEILPEEIGVTLEQPVTIEGLPITEQQAQKLISNMNQRKNFDRIIHVRFSVMIVYAKPIDVMRRMPRYNAEAQLLTIEFFEDEAMKQPIWVYTRA